MEYIVMVWPKRSRYSPFVGGIVLAKDETEATEKLGLVPPKSFARHGPRGGYNPNHFARDVHGTNYFFRPTVRLNGKEGKDFSRKNYYLVSRTGERKDWFSQELGIMVASKRTRVVKKLGLKPAPEDSLLSGVNCVPSERFHPRDREGNLYEISGLRKFDGPISLDNFLHPVLQIHRGIKDPYPDVKD